VLEFRTAIEEVERDGRRARQRDRELQRRKLDVIGHQQADVVTRAYAMRAEAGGEAACPGQRLGVRKRPLVRDHQGPVAVGCCTSRKELAEGAWLPNRMPRLECRASCGDARDARVGSDVHIHYDRSVAMRQWEPRGRNARFTSTATHGDRTTCRTWRAPPKVRDGLAIREEPLLGALPRGAF